MAIGRPYVLWCNSGCKGSWILTRALTLCLSNATPSLVSLLPIPLALNCRTLTVLSSLICLAGGAGVGDGEGGGGVDSCVFEAEQGSQVPSLFSDTVLHLRVRNISHSPIQNIWCTGSLLLDW